MAGELALAADRPGPETLPDRIAPWFTAATLLIAVLATAAWSLRDLGTGLGVGMAVLVVACPCALALAGPLTAAAGLGAAARRGLLVRGADALRSLAEVEVVALDKTGTLTRGEPAVVEADDAALRLAAGLERGSVHPIARAIVAEAVRRGIPLPLATDIVETPGVGIEGVIDGRRCTARSGGPGVVEVGGMRIRLADRLRPDAARTVAALQAGGRRVVLLTGDHAEVAASMARSAGIDEVVAGADPAAKRAWIAARRAEGRRVLFVGDGLNDGPALAEADVGIAMGGGATASVLVADAVVAVEGLAPVLAGLRAAEASTAALRGGALRSVSYNALAVGLAVAGLVNPLVAALLMPLSSAMVLLGAASVERRVARAERGSTAGPRVAEAAVALPGSLGAA
jgi:Cu+-exporting ATPase